MTIGVPAPTQLPPPTGTPERVPQAGTPPPISPVSSAAPTKPSAASASTATPTVPAGSATATTPESPQSVNPGAQETTEVTGPSGWLIAGLAALAIGIATVLVTRRRRT